MGCCRPEYSPTVQWNESSDASVTVLRAEVSRLKAFKDEADKANDRAHQQVVPSNTNPATSVYISDRRARDLCNESAEAVKGDGD